MVDIGAALRRSLALGVVVMLLTVLLSLGAGLAFRKKLAGGNVLFYVTVASLIMPSIIVSLGIGLQFRLLDGGHQVGCSRRVGADRPLESYTTSLGLFTSGLGAHLTWTLPFGLLIMFAVFNRFNPAYEEAARDQGATPWQTFAHVVLPLIAPVGGGHRHVRLHAELGRDRALVAGHRRPQHAAARAAGPDHHRHHAGDLRAGHGDDGDLAAGDRAGARRRRVAGPAQPPRASDGWRRIATSARRCPATRHGGAAQAHGAPTGSTTRSTPPWSTTAWRPARGCARRSWRRPSRCRARWCARRCTGSRRTA